MALGLSFLLMGMMGGANADTFQEPPDGFKFFTPAMVGTVTIESDGSNGSKLTFNGRCGANSEVTVTIGNVISENTKPDAFTREHLIDQYLSGAAELAINKGCVPILPGNSTATVNSLVVNAAGNVQHIHSGLATAQVVIFFSD